MASTNFSPGARHSLALSQCGLQKCGGLRVVIKSRGPGIFPGYQESGPRLLLLENRRKIEPKEIAIYLIPRLLVVFTRQLEILVTTLGSYHLGQRRWIAQGLP